MSNNKKAKLEIIIAIVLVASICITPFLFSRIPYKKTTNSIESRQYKIEFTKDVVIMNSTVEVIEVFFENKTAFLHQHGEGDILEINVEKIDNIILEEEQKIRVIYPKDETAPISASDEKESFSRTKAIQINPGGVVITQHERDLDSPQSKLCGVGVMAIFISGALFWGIATESSYDI